MNSEKQYLKSIKKSLPNQECFVEFWKKSYHEIYVVNSLKIYFPDCFVDSVEQVPENFN